MQHSLHLLSGVLDSFFSDEIIPVGKLSFNLDFVTFLTAGFRGERLQAGFNFEGMVNLTLSEKLNSGWEALSRKTASKKLQSRDKEEIPFAWNK